MDSLGMAFEGEQDWSHGTRQELSSSPRRVMKGHSPEPSRRCLEGWFGPDSALRETHSLSNKTARSGSFHLPTEVQ